MKLRVLCIKKKVISLAEAIANMTSPFMQTKTVRPLKKWQLLFGFVLMTRYTAAVIFLKHLLKYTREEAEKVLKERRINEY